MMKKFYKIFIALVIASPFSAAQDLTEPADFFKTVFKDSRRVNSFYTGGNPAYLHSEASDEMLSVKSVYLNEEGDYKRFIDPGNNRLYELSFTGKKSIDSFSVFKGSFGVQRIERNSWDLIFTKDIDSWNPYLLADASSGDAHFNGIVMNAGYSAIIVNRFLAGFNFNYNVDEGLKDIFPHPTSSHRDINFKAGAGYLLNSAFSVGGFLEIADNYENIDYQTDQEGINRETILLKYRGYALPVFYTKKDESRHSYGNKYAGYLTFSAMCGSSFSAAAYFGGGIEHLSITDGDGRPTAEGYTKNNFYKGGINALYNVAESINTGLYYDFIINNVWAKHPSYNVLMMENNYPRHIVKAGVDYTLNAKLKFGFEAGTDISKIDYKDYYSSLFWKSDIVKLIINAGSTFNISRLLNAEVYLGYEKCTTSNNSFLVNADLDNENAINKRKDDILFYQSGYDRFRVSFIPSCSLGNLGIVKLYANYSLIKPDKADWPGSIKRETADAVLEFRLNVY